MHQTPKLLNEILTFVRLIPPAYRLPLAALGVLIVGVIVAIIFVSSTATPMRVEAPPVVIAEPVPETQDPVSELFDPTEEQNAEQKRVAAATAQIDNILLNCYLLTKCNKMKPEEYNDTYQLLLTYAMLQKLAANLGEADNLVRERAKATAGSYELIYSRTTCGDIDAERLAANLDTWRRMTRLAPVRNVGQ